jgi:hypothetical protein
VRLGDHRLSVGGFVRRLEETVIATLRAFDIAAQKDDCAIGVWAPNPEGQLAKICALAWRRPSCTAIVCPTIWGKIVLARLHVRITTFLLSAFSFSTFLSNLGLINGPFFNERDICIFLLYSQ